MLPCGNGCIALPTKASRGWGDRPRSGRPPKVTCALEQHLNRLIDQDPLEHGSLHSQWSCRELATAFARETGVQLGRESVRGVLKKKRYATIVPPVAWILPRLISPMARSNWPPSSTGRAAARSFYSMKMKPSSGVLPCLGRAGGARTQRARLSLRPLSQSQIKRDESLKRQAWLQYRAWGRITLRRVAQCHWGGPVWHLQSLLQNCAAL